MWRGLPGSFLGHSPSCRLMEAFDGEQVHRQLASTGVWMRLSPPGNSLAGFSSTRSSGNPSAAASSFTANKRAPAWPSGAASPGLARRAWMLSPRCCAELEVATTRNRQPLHRDRAAGPVECHLAGCGPSVWIIDAAVSPRPPEIANASTWLAGSPTTRDRWVDARACGGRRVPARSHSQLHLRYGGPGDRSVRE